MRRPQPQQQSAYRHTNDGTNGIEIFLTSHTQSCTACMGSGGKEMRLWFIERERARAKDERGYRGRVREENEVKKSEKESPDLVSLSLSSSLSLADVSARILFPNASLSPPSLSLSLSLQCRRAPANAALAVT